MHVQDFVVLKSYFNSIHFNFLVCYFAERATTHILYIKTDVHRCRNSPVSATVNNTNKIGKTLL